MTLPLFASTQLQNNLYQRYFPMLFRRLQLLGATPGFMCPDRNSCDVATARPDFHFTIASDLFPSQAIRELKIQACGTHILSQIIRLAPIQLSYGHLHFFDQ